MNLKKSLLIAVALAGFAAAPFLISDYNLRILVVALQTAIAVIGLSVAFGWAGLIQLGQAAFIGLGAYGTAIAAMRFGLSVWLSIPLAMALSGLIALLIAVPMLRLRGHYLALATVGFNVTLEIIAKNWQSVTGGYDGISSIPGITLFGYELETDRGYYFLSLAILALVVAFAALLRHSRFGRAMIAVHDDEIATATSSVPVVRTKVAAFVISSVLAGLSGALYAHYTHFIAPADFDMWRSISVLVMVIVGGQMSIFGAVFGSVLLSFAPEWLRFVGDAYLAVFGVVVLIVLIFLPNGISGLVNKWIHRNQDREARHV